MSSKLHILPNASAGGTFKAAGLTSNGNEILVCNDHLSCGPLQPIISPSSWIAVREAYVRDLYWDYPGESWTFDEQDDDLYSNLDLLTNADEIHVWTGETLGEQLLVCLVLALTEHLRISAEKIRIVQFVTKPNRWGIPTGLGHLNPDELREHPPPRNVGDIELDALRQAWAAVTSPCPTALLDFLAGPVVSERLSSAMKSILQFYPEKGTGLNHFDETILRMLSSRTSAAPRLIGDSIRSNVSNLAMVDDSYWFQRLRRLGGSTLKQRPLGLEGGPRTRRGLRVKHTEYGRALLDGRANFVVDNGIDDWVGGVHLNSESGHVWFRDGEDLIRA